jgi:hypothetical protein
MQVAQRLHLRPFLGALVWIILREVKDHRGHVAVDGFPLFETQPTFPRALVRSLVRANAPRDFF